MEDCSHQLEEPASLSLVIRPLLPAIPLEPSRRVPAGLSLSGPRPNREDLVKSHIGTRLRATAMSVVGTHLIKAPTVPLTTRNVPTAEVVQVPTRHGDVRCYITRPAPDAPLAAGGTAAPVLINIHGGGFVVGNPRQDDHLVRGIAGEVGTVVVNVDYSTAPRVRFPQAIEECFDVLQWVAASGTAMNWDGNRIGLAGGSAGANIALGVLTLTGRHDGPTVRAASLLVPAVDLTIPPEDHISPIDKPFVSASMREMVNVSYFRKGDDKADPLASPAFLDDAELAALPPLLVLTAENDTFTPSINRFVTRARTAGATVQDRMFDGVDHDFYFLGTTPESTMKSLLDTIRDHLLTHLPYSEPVRP